MGRDCPNISALSVQAIFMSTTLKLSIEEYNCMVEMGAFDHLNRSIELVRGEIREMNPAGPLHNDLIAFLTDWSYQTTDRSRIRITVQAGLELAGQQSCPEPDLLWLRAGRYRDRHPTAADVKLAIEVSDSSLIKDLGEKVPLYAEAGIPECWIVDALGQCIYVYRNPIQGRYALPEIAKITDRLAPQEPCLTPLDLGAIFS